MSKPMPSLNRATARTPVPLARWLSTLAGRGDSEFLLGGTGHLQLSAAEEENVVTQLREGVLPRLFPDGDFAQVCLLTGLAPGSDLLFARVLGGWLLEKDIPFRMVGLLPVPPDTLLEDWLDNLREAGEDISPAQCELRRQQIETNPGLVRNDRRSAPARQRRRRIARQGLPRAAVPPPRRLPGAALGHSHRHPARAEPAAPRRHRRGGRLAPQPASHTR
ncbi:MAG: hypothetical protein ACHQIO_12645 [Nevskiales bacterium]